MFSIRRVFSVALLFLVLVVGQRQAEAKGSCATIADVGAKVWKVAGPTVKSSLDSAGPFGASAASAMKMIEKGIQKWNKIVGDKSWAKIGPRRLDFEEWNNGTLIGSTERLFLSGIPAVNPVVVDFHKLDGQGKVTVVICKTPEKGKAQEVTTFTIDSKTKRGKVRSIKIPNAKGHVISVVLHGKSFSKKLKYKVRATMDYPKEEVTATVSARRKNDSVSASRKKSVSASRKKSVSASRKKSVSASRKKSVSAPR